MKKLFAIIVAGGKGVRMGGDIPKQFLLLGRKPILMHSIEAFQTFNPDVQCIVVLPETQISLWNELCKTHQFAIPHSVVCGGKERFHSVQNGLAAITTDGIVAIHDGVRPLLSQQMIAEGFALADKQNSAIPYVDSVDSLRIINEQGTKTVNRAEIKRIQTPQFFNITELKSAMNAEFQPQFTDEATVWELSGRKLAFFKGDNSNIKITTPTDLKIGEILLNER